MKCVYSKSLMLQELIDSPVVLKKAPRSKVPHELVYNLPHDPTEEVHNELVEGEKTYDSRKIK